MTSAGFDEAWADTTVRQLAARGVEFTEGLTAADVSALGSAFGTPVPPELAFLLQAAVPVSTKWAQWTEGPDAVAAEARRWVHNAFAFDIEQNAYWHPSFGLKSADPSSAIKQALAVVDTAPPLFPIYAHRFLVSRPSDDTRAVLSVWQAVDSIFYGNDLADYLAREFGIDRPSWAATEAPQVPVWEDLFDLFCSGLPGEESS